MIITSIVVVVLTEDKFCLMPRGGTYKKEKSGEARGNNPGWSLLDQHCAEENAIGRDGEAGDREPPRK